MPRKKKTYKVTGSAPVDGHAPGETFEASYEEDRETFLVGGGHLTVQTGSSDKKD